MRKMGLRPDHDFRFTRNWFLNRNLQTFREMIFPEWAGKRMTYLEIGVFEGQSMVWMLQHILTHTGSFSVGVDPFLMTTKLDGDAMEEVRQRAFHNLSFYPQCQLIRGCSAEVLRRMVSRGGYAGIKPGTVDLCMIDGDHNRLAVIDDATLVLQLLRPSGWMLFDDFCNDKPKIQHVADGVESWLLESSLLVRELWRHRYMICFEKL